MNSTLVVQGSRAYECLKKEVQDLKRTCSSPESMLKDAGEKHKHTAVKKENGERDAKASVRISPEIDSSDSDNIPIEPLFVLKGSLNDLRYKF